MSAPTELDRSALRRGLFLVRSSEAGPEPARRLDADERRNASLVAALSRDQDEMCRHAVDAAEIAAGLEAIGLSDRSVRETYGVGGVFELAEILYELVPRRLTPGPLPRDQWAHPLRRHLTRGLLYALPTLPYLAALHLLGNELRGVAILLLGSMLALAATHGLSHLGYLLVGYGAPAAAGRLLRRSLLVTAVTATAGSAGLVALGLPWAPVLLASVQLVYVVAATAVLVFERDRLLLASLLPGLTAAAVLLTAGPTDAVLRAVGVAGLASCVLLASLAGVLATRTATPDSATVRLVPQEVRRVIAHGGYGALVAGLLMFAVLDVLWRGGGGDGAVLVGVGMLPLVLTMGVSEWQLHAFRSDSERIQHATHDFADFARRVRQALARRFVTYAAAVSAGAAAVVAAAVAGPGVDATVAWQVIGYSVLGLALFVAGVQLSCGIVRPTVALVGAAAAVEAGLLAGWQGSLIGLTLAQVVVLGGLLLALSATAVRSLGSPLRFR